MSIQATANKQFILVNEAHVQGPTVLEYNDTGIYARYEDAVEDAEFIREECNNPAVAVYWIQRVTRPWQEPDYADPEQYLTPEVIYDGYVVEEEDDVAESHA